ncbi:DJ-1/PfpI family protein (plasmid) [Variovorax sp. 375MFSha3.1]|uniref:DJ-1/PfpI family protein n=1 Tax=unclassified Variovorax TaxID=663243 RepID=UPI003AAB9D6F
MELPAPLPRVLDVPTAPEVDRSPALSLLTRPGDGGIRTRKIAILVADGIEGAPIAVLVSALVDAGAVPRLVGSRLGRCTAADGTAFEADASMENSPNVLFDALVLPDGLAALESLTQDGHTMEFVKEQYRHCKTILAFGASQALLAEASIPMTLPDGSPDPGLILAEAKDAADASRAFIAAAGMHRHLERETDPPMV